MAGDERSYLEILTAVAHARMTVAEALEIVNGRTARDVMAVSARAAIDAKAIIRARLEAVPVPPWSSGGWSGGAAAMKAATLAALDEGAPAVPANSARP